MMDQSIRKFIQKHYERGDYYTHVSLIQPNGRFKIERESIETFWKIYCDSLNTNQNMICGLAEKPGNFIPVLCDCDIKIKYTNDIIPEKLYTDKHIKSIVSLYQRCLKDIIKDYEPKHGICFVLEKETPTLYQDKKHFSQGIHLHFIYTIMNRVDQDMHLLPRVRKEVQDQKLFQDLDLENTEVIDKVTNKNWLLYGSRKQEGLQPYKLTKIFNDQLNEISLTEATSKYELQDIQGNKIEMKNPNYYLPRILSIDTFSNESLHPVELSSNLNIITKTQIKLAKDSDKKYENIPIEKALKEIKELIDLLSPKRADNFHDWINLGWTLYNIGDGCQEVLDIWINFSSKTTKTNYFSETVCLYEWEKMERRNKTMGSLMHWAKEDSPEKFKKLMIKRNEKHLLESLNGGHFSLAKILYNNHCEAFKCACVEKDIWFKFENHGWKVDKKGIELRKKISTELVDMFRDKKKKICEAMGEEEEDDTESQKKLKQVNKIIGSLQSSPFKNSIMKECQELFYDEYFAEKLDNNLYLIRFNNGVLDLNELRLRNGEPKDYLSLYTGYDYKEMKWDDIEVIETLDYLRKIFPDQTLRQYFLEYCASLLKGGNSSKTFLVMSGEGDNGKSITMDLLELVLGKYFRVLPTSLIVGKRTQSSAATPEIANIQGIRFVVLQEPNSKDVINIGILKEFSGNDMIYVRGLYKDPQSIRPMFKMSLICNKLPRLPCDDPATWNRIRVLTYESKFPKDINDVPDSIEEQFAEKIFPRDNFFAEKLPRMKQAFMWILVETYKKMIENGRMVEPEKVQNATLLYRKNNDVFLQYVSEKIIYDPDNEKAFLSVVEVYSSFREWFRESYPNMSIPTKIEMKEDFLKRWGDIQTNHKWKGYRIRTIEDDEKEGKLIILREKDLEQQKKKKNKEEEDDDEMEEKEEREEKEEQEDSSSDSDDE